MPHISKTRLLSVDSIPTHLVVAGSAWASRIVAAVVQLLSIRILLGNLGAAQYAAFALLSGLIGWYMLADMGVGFSLQNYISERRASNESCDDYIASAGILAIILMCISILLLYVLSPYLASIFLRQFTFMNEVNKADNFFAVGAMFIGTAIGGIAYKIWYAQHKGYLSNIFPAIASLAGLCGIWLIAHFDIHDKLFMSLVAFIVPTSVLPIIAFSCQILKSIRNGFEWKRYVISQILRRAWYFWLFAILAAGVLQIDYIVMSQFLPAKDIVVYNISSKIYSLIFFFYSAILFALWPLCAEEIAENQWESVMRKIKRYLRFGIGLIAAFTLVLFWIIPIVVHLLSPTEQIDIPLLFIMLLGIYYLLRVWTDTFAMVLQSMSDLRPFWIFVPIQAILSIFLQFILVPYFGVYGVISGLIGSFSLTVMWALPIAVRHHMRITKGARS